MYDMNSVALRLLHDLERWDHDDNGIPADVQESAERMDAAIAHHSGLGAGWRDTSFIPLPTAHPNLRKKVWGAYDGMGDGYGLYRSRKDALSVSNPLFDEEENP